MNEQNKSMFAHLGIDDKLIPTLKKRVGDKYHHLYSFLYSSFSSSVSPFFFNNMDKIIDFLLVGVKNQSTFYILGDKDADGTSATSILKLYLEEQNCKVYYNTPLDNETYGSSERMLEDIRSKQKEIYAVITVDTGIKEYDLVLELQKLSIPFIITDHHTPEEPLPDTPYIFNPHLHKDYFFPICGTYVSLKLIHGLFLALSPFYNQKTIAIYYNIKKQLIYYTPLLEHIFIPYKNYQVLSIKDNLEPLYTLLAQTQYLVTTQQTYDYLHNQKSIDLSNISQSYIMEELQKQYKPSLHPKKPRTFYPSSPTYGLLLFVQEWIQTHVLYIEEKLSMAIQIAGIATICDRMPMNHFENRGIVKSAFHLFFKDKNHPFYPILKEKPNFLNFTTQVIPMQFCPLLNAGGRLGKAPLVIEFLSSNEHNRVQATEKLQELNKERQKKQKIGLQEVEEFINLGLHKPYIIYASENIHKGVTGIIANKITKLHQKPTFILSVQKENNTLVGSARSLIPVHPFLEKTKDLFLAFGGHQKACGFSLKQDSLSLFIAYLDSVDWNINNSLDSIKESEAEIYDINIEDCSDSFYHSLELLHPYGEEHEPPIFKTKVRITQPEVFGKNKTHIKWFPQNKSLGQFIFWNALDIYPLEDLLEREFWAQFTIHKNSFYKNRYDFMVFDLSV